MICQQAMEQDQWEWDPGQEELQGIAQDTMSLDTPIPFQVEVVASGEAEEDSLVGAGDIDIGIMRQVCRFGHASPLMHSPCRTLHRNMEQHPIRQP